MKSKKKTIIGLLMVVAFFAIAFGVTPLMSQMFAGKVSVVRVVQEVPEGTVIKESDVDIVSVGEFNLPASVEKDISKVIGKFAKVDLLPDDYITAAKLSDDGNSTDTQLRSLNKERLAISVDVSSLPNSVSGRIQKGDIVSLIVTKGEGNDKKSFVPDELRYLQVLTTTTSEGIDSDNVKPDADGNIPVPATVTLYATERQATMIATYRSSGSLCATLAYRGDADVAQQLLDEQAKILGGVDDNAEPLPDDIPVTDPEDAEGENVNTPADGEEA